MSIFLITVTNKQHTNYDKKEGVFRVSQFCVGEFQGYRQQFSFRKEQVNTMKQFAIQNFWNYERQVFDMGLEPDDKGQPAFYILKDNGEHISVTITRSQELTRVIQWLNHLNTGVRVEFKDFEQFNRIIQKVFKIYAERQGLLMHYDNTMLKDHLTAFKGQYSEYDVARLAGVGRSTVNDLRRRITRRPKFFTVCKIHSAIYQLEHGDPWKVATQA